MSIEGDWSHERYQDGVPLEEFRDALADLDTMLQIEREGPMEVRAVGGSLCSSSTPGVSVRHDTMTPLIQGEPAERSQPGPYHRATRLSPDTVNDPARA